MSDDELDMLLRELEEVQEEKTNPLSDRTVAQILIKLHQNGFKFYSTTDNNEYITPSQIDAQIIKIVQERGRLSLSILPQLLNLNQDLIQSRTSIICNKSTHVRHNSWLISQDYIKNMLLSLKQRLEVCGLVELDEEALKYEFDIKFMEKIIQDHADEFDADIKDHKMITREYLRMKKMKILGFLLAVTRPIEVSTVGKLLLSRDEKKDTFSGETQNLVRELIAENKLKGKFQNLFYIPDRFSSNQKAVICKFLQNNGYLEYAMLQKNYMVPKPEEWVKKNLDSKDYLIYQGICFRKSLLTSYQSQLDSLMKGDGFAQISSVIPFDMEEKKMNRFLTENCELKNFILNEGICYSKQWIDKCVNEFRHRVIFEIFFKEEKGKKDSKGKKKVSKKEKSQELTEQELIETLFDAGLAEYSIAQNIADSLLPVLKDKLEGEKVKLQKQLTQSQGVISSKFLQYKRCKTIVRSPQNLTRLIKMIEKQKKKLGVWVDPDFGPCENDEIGQYSLIFYDKITPKNWPPIEQLKWRDLTYQQIFKTQSIKNKLMSKSLLVEVLGIIQCFNRTSPVKFNTPFLEQQSEEPPYYFRFFIDSKQHRYVLVDNRMPYFSQQGQGDEGERIMELNSRGVFGMVEKAYAKFRYCYKSLLNISFNQLFTELTGANKIEKLDLTELNLKSMESVKEVLMKVKQIGWSQNKLVIFMAEGKQGKKADLTLLDQSQEVFCLVPYLAISKEDTLLLLPNQIQVQIDQKLFITFSNVWVITP